MSRTHQPKTDLDMSVAATIPWHSKATMMSTNWQNSTLLITGEKSALMVCCMSAERDGYTRRLSSRLSTPGIKSDALERTIQPKKNTV